MFTNRVDKKSKNGHLFVGLNDQVDENVKMPTN